RYAHCPERAGGLMRMDLSMKLPRAPRCITLGITLLLCAPPSRGADDRNSLRLVPTDPNGELLRDSPGGTPRKFLPATQEEAAAAIASFKKAAAEVENVLHVKFGTIETPHFLVFT